MVPLGEVPLCLHILIDTTGRDIWIVRAKRISPEFPQQHWLGAYGFPLVEQRAEIAVAENIQRPAINAGADVVDLVLRVAEPSSGILNIDVAIACDDRVICVQRLDERGSRLCAVCCVLYGDRRVRK